MPFYSFIKDDSEEDYQNMPLSRMSFKNASACANSYDLGLDEEYDDLVFEDPAYYNFDSEKIKSKIENLFAARELTFSERVLEIIRQKDLSEIAVYKRAHLDRKLFSKLRSNAYYKPSRNTAVALTLALELNINEAEDLLGRAGFALSKAVPEDIVVSYFLEHQIYSVLALNEILYAFALSPLSE